MVVPQLVIDGVEGVRIDGDDRESAADVQMMGGRGCRIDERLVDAARVGHPTGSKDGSVDPGAVSVGQHAEVLLGAGRGKAPAIKGDELVETGGGLDLRKVVDLGQPRVVPLVEAVLG